MIITCRGSRQEFSDVAAILNRKQTDSSGPSAMVLLFRDSNPKFFDEQNKEYEVGFMHDCNAAQLVKWLSILMQHPEETAEYAMLVEGKRNGVTAKDGEIHFV